MPQIGRSLAYLATSQGREPTNRTFSLPVAGVATKEQLLVPTALLSTGPLYQEQLIKIRFGVFF